MSSATATIASLHGRSLIAGRSTSEGGEPFRGFHPADGRALDPVYLSARPEDVEQAVAAAVEAAPALAASSGKQRGALLRRIADGIDAAAEALIERAHLETALPLPRLKGEVARTGNQLRLFAAVAEEGSWVMARIDTADPARTPPKPDVRAMLRPLGPVAVFGASNFPLAFSVAGGDTASALAAGNPVIVKAHPAHPATGELVGQIVAAAIAESGLPAGSFSLLFDRGHAVGSALVQHPAVRAVGFTGSLRGGRALMDLVAKREEPIPIFAEMGSTNPVFVLSGALAARGEELATGLHGSFTLGGGQLCTKPGLVFFGEENASRFTNKLRAMVDGGAGFALLTEGIASAYGKEIAARAPLKTASGAAPSAGFGAETALLETTYAGFAADAHLAEEVFGPSTLLVRCHDTAEMLAAARALKGHLTATVLGTEEDLARNPELLQILETKVGRVLFNGFPTGVEVGHAMVHGGPYPATSDGRSTSVGSLAIYRFCRPVCYQGMPQSALPPALKDENPEAIHRLWNGEWGQ
jgi:alpha-ketoglutaric semialdehyde dehydrogenase